MSWTEKIITHSEDDTFRLGERLAAELHPPVLILLHGDLGTGKTVLIRGICHGLGYDRHKVRSPSYTLVNEYRARYKIYHLDLYRLGNNSDTYGIGLDDILADTAVVLVEWAEKMTDDFPDAIRINLQHQGQNERLIEIIRPDLHADS